MCRHVALWLVPAIVLVACREQAQQPSSQRQTQTPPTAAPADVSHGEAPVGVGAEPAPIDPVAPARSTSRLHRLRINISHTKVPIAAGVTYDAWTFDNRVPGPVLRVTQGDTVDFTLVNRSPMPHSLDFHAAEIAPNRAYRNLMPRDSIHYRFVARVPGAFMYHCGTAPVALHIANGMYGAIIVDPRQGRPAAREFVFVQSEFYTKVLGDSTRAIDWDKLLGLAPDYVVFNGRAAVYAKYPIRVQVGEPLRMYVVNAGPNRFSAFHVVGAIFDRVFQDGSLAHPLEGVQTVTVPVGGGAIFETRLVEAGTYPFVSHAFADATKGAVGMFEAQSGAMPAGETRRQR
ncbi:MAG TPA: multicopper oxidase domain-containing protein [Gemmatimonadales bacterium]|nr:multicopper oxidase domain-containing protein [Gemmatimonadales bacterium]